MNYTAKPKDEKNFCRILISKDANHVAIIHRLSLKKQFHHQKSEEQALETAKEWINDNLFKIDNIQADNQNETRA